MSKKLKVTLRSDRGYLYFIIPCLGLMIKQYLDMQDTPENRLKARELAEQIDAEIRTNVFDFVKHFPGSKNIEKYKLGRKIAVNATLGEVIEMYKASLDKKLTRKEISKSTRKSYLAAISTVSRYLVLDKWISAFHQSEIQDMIEEMEEDELSGKTINNYMTPLNQVFELAYQRDIVDKNIMDRVKVPRYSKPPIHAFSKTEMLTILDYVNENHTKAYPIILFLFATGVRGGEMCACRWENMNFDKNYYHVKQGFAVHELGAPKTASSVRKVRIPEKLKLVLNDLWIEQGKPKKGFMFLTSYGEAYTSTRHIIKDYWKPTLKALGIPYRRMYNTRHTFAVLSIDAGVKLSEISRNMGHASMQMVLEVYSKPADEDPEENEFDSTFDM